ncbi:MAG: polysaccharide biosynthesis/export family protein [Muribaculaceae bacterium]|nr:polysaccharide biosynthesis/export family protein [Muribaculaceae bacterium]MDE6332620.1 polysaccharide biosynthesis/export family protein [Muribaculaceae bacterium]
MKAIKTTLAIAVAAGLCACSAPKKVPYLVDADTLPAEVLQLSAPVPDPVLGPGDLLNIEVTGSLPTALAPFNKGQYVSPDGNISTMTNRTTTSGQGSGAETNTQFYLVDNQGDIDFPVLGKIHVTGLTKSQLVARIADDIYPKYVTERPTVDVRLMNFRVTVLGAVGSPGVIQSKNERMNFLEAIALAGDLNIKGERENIMLVRTNADGSREVHRMNIHDKNLLLSPYFNLQQNDFIYVEPNPSMRQSAWQLNSAVGATSAIVGTISATAGLVVGIINLAK